MKRSPLIVAVATTALVLGAAPSMASSAKASPDEEFSLAVRGRWCLQANGNGWPLDSDDCEYFRAPWQLWRKLGDDMSKMRVQSVHDDACLAEENRGAWITETCSDSTTQQWKVTTRDVDGKQQVKLQNVATGDCMLQGDGDCESDPTWLTVIGAGDPLPAR
ncbi:hypothetical protein [Streptomyces celluloflavus]|uniref:hypothetical protein n=1 Tax=Streptomyces celluloflavus TaxID=58344 RepID=UPI003682FFD9